MHLSALLPAITILLATTIPGQGSRFRGPGELIPRQVKPVPVPRGPLGQQVPPAPFPGRAGPGQVFALDLTRWQFWWAFRVDEFAPLPKAPPLDSELIDEKILPALLRHRPQNQDIDVACMIAATRSGRQLPATLAMLRKKLGSDDQRIRETAALCLGLSGTDAAADDLCALLLDTHRGRRICKRDVISERTRSFAGWGLGLLAQRYKEPRTGLQIFSALKLAILDPSITSCDIRVTVAHALGSLRVDRSTAAGRRQFFNSLDTLEQAWKQPTRTKTDHVVAHAVTATARLLEEPGDDDETRARIERVRSQWIASIDRGPWKSRNKQAIILALGRLAASRTNKHDTFDALSLTAASAKDLQARNYARIAMARIGHDRSVPLLLNVLKKGTKALEKPWAAVSLGLASRGSSMTEDQRDQVSDDLCHWLSSLKNPESRAAMAIALGLMRHKPAAPLLRQLLQKYKNREEFAGYVATSLALMQDKESLVAFQDLLMASVRRPSRLASAAKALARLAPHGDDPSLRILLDVLVHRGSNNTYVNGALARALGSLGKSETVIELIQFLESKKLPPHIRATAATALGLLADPSPRPWNAEIAERIDYRAMTPTMSNQISGFLDRL